MFFIPGWNVGFAFPSMQRPIACALAWNIYEILYVDTCKHLQTQNLTWVNEPSNLSHFHVSLTADINVWGHIEVGCKYEACFYWDSLVWSWNLAAGVGGTDRLKVEGSGPATINRAPTPQAGKFLRHKHSTSHLTCLTTLIPSCTGHLWEIPQILLCKRTSWHFCFNTKGLKLALRSSWSGLL